MKAIYKNFSFVLAVMLLIGIFFFVDPTFAKSSNVGQETIESTEETENFTITVTEGAGGSISVDKTEAAAGDEVIYTVTPDEGYKIKSVKIGDESIPVKKPYTEMEDSFTVTGDVELSALFTKLKTYKISTHTTKGGTITKTTKVKENDSVTIKAKQKKGYHLTELRVDGKSLGKKTSYSFKNVTRDHSIKSIFTKDKIGIMLDAGHYGNRYNHSPVFKSYYESNMTWQLHRYLKQELEKYNGVYVGTTRVSKAKDRDVYYRGAASKGYDLFLSLHSNYSSDFSDDAPMVIYQKKNGATKTLIKNIGSTIRETMGTRQGYTYWTRTNKDGKTEYYGVLRGAANVKTRGLILEHSFHSNYKMTKWLSSNANLKKLAKAEAKALANYYHLQLK